MTWILLASGLVAFAVSALAVPPLSALARRTGFLDHPGPRKVHDRPIPYGGGLAVSTGILTALGGGLIAAWAIARGMTFGLPAEIVHHAAGALSKARELLLLLGGALVIQFLGLVDDRKKLGPGFKLLVQSMVAAGFVLGGERLSLFWEGSLAGDLVGGAVTVLWIVGITNSFNLLDHMDGICAGTAVIASLAFGAVAWLTGQWFVAAAIAALGGACAGFLIHNFPPARIFLGDAGSLFIGFVLATLTVVFTFFERDRGAAPYAWTIPLAVLAVPLYDTAGVVWIRWRAGRPLFQGDRNHLAHRLRALGLSDRQAALSVWSLTALTGLAAVLLLRADGTGAILILSQLAATFGIISLLQSAGRRHGRTDDTRPTP